MKSVSFIFFSLSLSLEMTDRAPGQGAEREAAAHVVTCSDVPPQEASGRGGGGQQEEVREFNMHQAAAG